MGQIKAVTIEVEVFVRETDEHFFALSGWEQHRVATAVEHELNMLKSEDSRNDWTIVATQIKNVIK